MLRPLTHDKSTLQRNENIPIVHLSSSVCHGAMTGERRLAPCIGEAETRCESSGFHLVRTDTEGDKNADVGLTIVLSY